MDGQKNRYNDDEKIDRWILFFLDCMLTLIQRLENKYETYKKLEKELNDRQKEVLKFIENVKMTTIGSIEKAFKITLEIH